MEKKTTYLLGLASGVVLMNYWKFIVKEGVKIGVKVGRNIKQVSVETLEDLEDVTAEAMQDLADQEAAGAQQGSARNPNRTKANI
jgi:hypothetical protein